MKSNTRKKILALFAAGAIAVAGAAYAAITIGVLSSSTNDTDPIVLNNRVAYKYTSPQNGDARDPRLGISLGSDTVTLKGNITPATVANLGSAAIFNVAGDAVSTIAAYNSVVASDQGGAITLDDAQVLNIRPAGTAPDNNDIAGAAASALDTAANATGGIFRFNGGTVNMYGANANAPDAPSNVVNTFADGVFMMKGRLNLAHSNALGRSPLTLAHNTTLGVIETSNLDFGNNDPYGTPLPRQTITLQRHDNNLTGPTDNQIQATRPITFDTPLVGASNTKSVLRVYRGMFQNANAAPANADYNHVQVVKTGEGQLTVDSAGMHQTGGTWVKDGLLFVDGGDTNRYVGAMGFTYATLNETQVAKNNYTGERVEPTYNNTNTANDPLYTQFLNPVLIDEIGTIRVNRDQFIGDLNGSGNFEFVKWVKNTQDIIPQLTMQLNNATALQNGKNALFSGVISGTVNLVLDNSVMVTGAGNVNNGRTLAINTFPRIQALTGANKITIGDTFIKDGTLSIPGNDRIGPDTLRIGMYANVFSTAANGFDPGSNNFRGFGETQNVATFHASDTFTVEQPTLVYAIGKNVPAAPLSNQSVSVTWYGNNPTNAAIPLANVEDGRYNTGNRFVNLAATRGKMVSFPDIKLTAEAASIGTIAQHSGRNDIRYIMRNAMSINDKLDENPDWDGTVCLSGSWDMVGATPARMFGFDIRNGTLRIEKEEQGGYALVGIRQAATLAFGPEARKFDDSMQVVIEDDARICVTPVASDLATSLAGAQTKDAIFLADSINYTGLGMGTDHTDKRLVVQVDISKIDPNTEDMWIKAVGSMHATNWNNIHYYSASATGQNEHKYKVLVAQPGNKAFDQDYEVTAYCDENQYNIYVHIKKMDTPVTSDRFHLSASAKDNQIDAGVTYTQADGVTAVASEDITFSIQKGTETPITKKAVTDANGKASVSFTGLAAGTYSVAAEDSAGNVSTAKSVVVSGGTPISSSSSSGCDAGFGAFALLAMAGGALVLRKKD